MGERLRDGEPALTAFSAAVARPHRNSLQLPRGQSGPRFTGPFFSGWEGERRIQRASRAGLARRARYGLQISPPLCVCVGVSVRVSC